MFRRAGVRIIPHGNRDVVITPAGSAATAEALSHKRCMWTTGGR